MIIYLDAVWALNFFLDMMLLQLTQYLAKDNTKIRRLVLGAFIASLIVPLTLYFPNFFLTSFYGKFLYSIIIIVCSFRFQTVYQTIKLLFLFYFTSFSIGGGLLAIHFLFQNPMAISANNLFVLNNSYGDPVSWLFVLICFPVVWLFTKRSMDKHAIEKIRYDQLCPITIEIKGISYSTTGYIDSGNQLVDPLTKKPVIICDEPYLKQWFTDNEWEELKKAHNELNFETIPDDWKKWIHIIPYQGVEGNSNFLIAINPDKLIISYDNKTISTSKILVGIQFAELTKDRSYHCLLQPQIIKFSVHSA